MKPKIIISGILLALALPLSAQVSISNDGTQPHGSAMLEVKTISRGFLPPRLTSDQRNGIPSPALGLLIFNTDCNDIQFYNGAAWVPLGNTGVLATPGTINGNAAPCSNSSGMNYYISPVIGAAGYHWTVPLGASISSGQGTAGITVAFGNTSGQITVTAYNSCFKSNLQSLNVTMAPVLPVSVIIAASVNPVCTGISVTYTAAPVNGGPNPSYQWRKNGSNISGATNPTYAYTPLNADAISCLLTSSLICKTGSPAVSNTINMTVNPNVPVMLSVKSLPHPHCSDPTYTFQATSNPVVTNPLYQWFHYGSLIPGATNSTYSFVPDFYAKIECRLTSNSTCISGGYASDYQSAGYCDMVCYGQPIQLGCWLKEGCETGSTFHWENSSGSWSVTGTGSNAMNPVIYAGEPGYATDAFYLTVNFAPPGNGMSKGVNFIEVVPEINYTAIVINLSCAGMCSGSINLTTSGGAPPYTYLWSNGMTTEDIGGLCAGSYTVSITDAANCTKSGTLQISSPSLITLTGVPAATGCIGSCDGLIGLTVSGGVPPYTYAWSNGATTEDLTGLCAGTYSVTVTDANLCTKSGSWSVGSSPTLIYGGQTYNTKKIGNQCWLKENLNIGIKISGSTAQTNNGIIEKYCYNDGDGSCTAHGGLYQWSEMMNYTSSSNSNPSGRQGICPSGWHLPSDAEWCQMESYLDPTANCSNSGWQGTDPGGKMKETGLNNWAAPNTGATNSSGFTGIGGGYGTGNGNYSNQTYYAYLWSATEYSSTDAWNRRLGYNTAQEGRFFGNKTGAFSVRCLKN